MFWNFRWPWRFGRKVWLLLAVLLVAVLSVPFWITTTTAYQHVPDEVWRTGDPAAIAEALRAPRVVVEEGSNTPVPAAPSDAPPALVRGAARWVQEVNRFNPDAILYHEVDPFGTLYVVFGGWWLDLTPDQQVKALDGLGVAWRHYLATNYAKWDTRDGLAPGIVVVDEHGEVARNLDGKIAILRTAVY